MKGMIQEKPMLINVLDDDESVLQLPVIHIKSADTKSSKIMNKLWNCFNYWLKCPLDKQKILTELGDALFNVSLLIDDLEDNSVLRRGLPTAHLIYGVPLTIYAIIHKATKLFNKFMELAKNQNDFSEHFIRLGIKFFVGQGLEIYFREQVICPTVEDYKNIVNGKVGEPLKFGICVLQIFDEKVTQLYSPTLLGDASLFLQIYNDYTDLHNPKYSSMRVFCDDLDEGKFGFPMIHAIQTYPDDHRVLDIIRERPKDIERKKHFVKLLEELGSFQYTRKILKKLTEDIDIEIESLKLKENPFMKKFFQNVYNNIETEIILY